MARLFDSGLTEYLIVNSGVYYTYPFAISCLFRSNDLTPLQILISQTDKDADNQRLLIYMPGGGGSIKIQLQDAGGQFEATSSTGATVDTWHLATAIFVSATDRRILIDGGSKGTNANNCTPANIDQTTLGILDINSGQFSPFSGDIAEAVIWDLSDWTGATASDKADLFETIIPALVSGYSPMMFPLGIQAYWPLIRGLNDKVGGYNVTASGTVVSNHTRIINPFGPQVASPTVAPVAAGGIMTCNTGYWGAL